MGTSGKVPRPWTHEEVQILGLLVRGGPLGVSLFSAVAVMASGMVSTLTPSYFSKGDLAILFSLDQRYCPLPLD